MKPSRILCTGGSGFIGTHLIHNFADRGIELLNIDIEQPKVNSQSVYMKRCDILDKKALIELFSDFLPTCVIHLAARTDIEGNSLVDYVVNTDGTANVLEAVRVTPSVKRVIITSTQFVHGPGHLPENDEDFEPYTVYGESKVITEQMTRSAGLECIWTIIRPTVIWGAWHPLYPRELWQTIKKRQYFHPGRKPIIRSYGYVGNVVFQIERILQSPATLVNRKVYYVGDMPMSQLDWANGFSQALTGRDVNIMPKALLCFLALFGALANALRIRFPMYPERYRRMTEDYLTPMAATLEAFGPPPYSFDDGVRETVAWLQEMGLV